MNHEEAWNALREYIQQRAAEVHGPGWREEERTMLHLMDTMEKDA